MNLLNKSAHWEEFFIQESLELEEKMKTLDGEALNKSKLRICLENGILDWAQYEKWYMSQQGCSSLRPSLDSIQLQNIIQLAKKAETDYSQFQFWGMDLIPLTLWDNQLIVLGLQYCDQLVSLGEHVFILAPPQILALITQKLAAEKPITLELSEDSKSAIELDVDSAVTDALEGLNFNQAAPKMSFTLMQPPMPSEPIQAAPVATIIPPNPTPNPPPPPLVPPTQTMMSASPSVFTTSAEPTDGVWEFIAERHQEFSFEVKKQFDAFVILKIINNKTHVFKMDADLNRQNVNPVIFEYNLESDGPFKTISKSKRSDTFSLKQMNMFLADYKYAFITPLTRGEQAVGFFVGFKKSALSEKDKNLLEELADEMAS